MTAMAQVEILRAACCIAGADEKVDEKERQMLNHLASRVGVGEASLNAMILRAETEPDFFQTQFQVLKSNPDSTIRILFQVAASDGAVEPNQVEMLKHFADRLDMDENAFRNLVGSVSKG